MTMRQALRRAICSVYSRGVLPSPPLPLSFAVLTPPRSRFYSSIDDKFNGLDSTSDENKDSDLSTQVRTAEGVILGFLFSNLILSFLNSRRNSELRTKIDRFYGGDVELLPSIFEAILKRKLSGKHDEADDELMKELRRRSPGQVEDFDEAMEVSSDSDDDEKYI